MSETLSSREFRNKINWGEIYTSDLLRRLKQKRMAFVVPAVVFTAFIFANLWTIQNYVPGLSNLQVFGWVNLQFIYTMLLFPVLWLAGFAYTRYASRVLEPLEQAIHDTYSTKEDYDG